jgi:ABC-type taurine transport system substrate-binding protein
VVELFPIPQQDERLDFATKSAKTWDLMAFRGANEIVSPMISTAHFAILPEASRHWMISPRGKDDTTVTG